MSNFSFDMTISLDVIIATAAFLGTIVGGIWAVITNTKKYELTEALKTELLFWYKDTISIMIALIHLIENNASDPAFTQNKHTLLCRLSAQIEVGRFYFPNVNKGDKYGADKPLAYQGYRNITIEFLMHFYRIGKLSNCQCYITSLWELERYFTSEVYRLIDPVKRKKVYSKNTDFILTKGKSIQAFLRENPEHRQMFWQ